MCIFSESYDVDQELLILIVVVKKAQRAKAKMSQVKSRGPEAPLTPRLLVF